VKDLRRYKSVKRWFSQVFSSGIRSVTTEKNYLIVLRQFCEYAKKTPDQLILERREHLKSDDELVRRQHEELLTDWINYLEEKRKLARGSVVTMSNTIRSFYKANYVELQMKSPKLWRTRERKVPTQEELKLMVENARGIRDKAVIMFLAQTGVSLGDFLDLVTYGRIKNEFERGVEPLHLPMERTKIKKKYDTFLGSDGVEFLREYLRDRRLRSNHPIFDISRRTVEYIVASASRRASLKPTVTPHKLRSFFSTRLKLAGCPEAQVEYWMGHVVPYRGAYFVPPVEEQRKIYKKFEWSLSIEG